MSRVTLFCLAMLITGSTLSLVAREAGGEERHAGAHAEEMKERDDDSLFENVSDRIDFLHRSNGGEALAGAAWVDFDTDGFLDLFLTNGIGHPNALYRNNGDGTFTDVGRASGITNGLGNSGVIAGDIDNDGLSDIYLTGEGDPIMGVGQSPNRLYRNNGDGTFSDITEKAGVAGAATSWSAAFADINNDGYLDLFVTSPGSLAKQERHRNKLYLNNGDATFTDISASAGVDRDSGSCAATFSDYDDDGFIDLFVGDCNDIQIRPQLVSLYRNNGNLTFSDVTDKAGLHRLGAWMGFAVADYNNDGYQDVFATNVGPVQAGNPEIARSALYRNNGDGTFSNVEEQAGVAELIWGWGASALDFNNDGHEDIFFAGSFPISFFGVIGPGLGNPGTLYMNEGAMTFHKVSLPIDLSNEYSSGVAVADFDNDGFQDIVVALGEWNGRPGRPVLLRNVGNDNGSLTIRLVGTRSNHDAIGARVSVGVGRRVLTKEVRAGSSFLSMDSQWLTYGLGKARRARWIEVRWPSGVLEHFEDVPAEDRITIIEGKGIVTEEKRQRVR